MEADFFKCEHVLEIFLHSYQIPRLTILFIVRIKPD